MRTVLANGCFDVLHVGHVRHLEAARRMGDRLIVSLTEDAFVNKGLGLPIHAWEHRAEVLRALRCVDAVVPSKGDVEAIRRIKPDFFVKGIDYEHSPLLDDARAVCLEVGALLCITETPKWSSRSIVQQMRMAQC